jgi:hypothetical protein
MNVKMTLVGSLLFGTFCIVGYLLLYPALLLTQLLIDNPILYAIWCVILYGIFLYRIKDL